MDEQRAYAAFGLLSGICVALAALAVYAFASSSTEQETRTVASYSESGVYTYAIAAESSPQSQLTIIGPFTASATDPTAPVPAPVVATGSARSFDFSYNYELQGEAPEVTGTISATLELSAGSAWSEKRDLTPPTPFQGPTGSLSTSLDFAQINALLQQVNTRTGASADEYELLITPVVKVQGRVAGTSFTETFSTPLSITYTSTEVTPGETLGFVEDRTISAAFTADREIGLFGPALAVKTLRLALTPLAALALIGAAAMGMIALHLGTPRAREAGPSSESPRPQPTLVAVSSVVSGGGPRISVASLQELEKLARNNTVFVRQFSTDARVYFVHDGAAIYQFAIGEVPEDWVQPIAGAPVMITTAAATTPEPAAPEQIPEYLIAPGDEEALDGGAPALAPANVAPETDAALMEGFDGEVYAGTNGHHAPSENGHESEYADADEAQGAFDDLDDGDREGLLAGDEGEAEATAEAEMAAPPPAYQTRPLYVRNREGAERARAWLKRKYGAGQLSEPVARAAERTESEAAAEPEAATFDIEAEAGTAEAMADEQALIEETIEIEAAEVEVEVAIAGPWAEEPALTAEAIEVEAAEVEAAIAEPGPEEPGPAVEAIEVEAEAEAATAEPWAEVTPVEAIVEAEIEAGIAIEDPRHDEEAIEPTEAVLVAEAEDADAPSEVAETALEVEASAAEVAAPVSAPEPATPAAREPAPYRPTVRRRRRSLNEQALDFVRKKVREFLEYPPS